VTLDDTYTNLAAAATTKLLEAHETVQWGIMAARVVTPFAVELLHQDLGGAEDLAFEAALGVVEQIPEQPLGPETSVVIGGPELEAEIKGVDLPAPEVPQSDAPETPAAPTSTEIGGPQVDAHITEIKNLQTEHETALKSLEAERDEAVQKQASLDDNMAKSYFEGHPDQTPEDRTRDEQKFDAAKSLNQQDVETKYETKITELKASQAVEMSTLQAKQVAPSAAPAPPPPSAPPPPETRDR
jgi:hypothetical protein